MRDMRISIVLPTYNVKDYIGPCISSLTQQTYEDLEILIVNDGSTDGTDALCDELAATDSRIRVFHKEIGEFRKQRVSILCLWTRMTGWIPQPLKNWFPISGRKIRM